MKKLSLICMTVLAISFLASCRGPQGPQGPAGHDGNANVASSTVTVSPQEWYWDNNTSWRVDFLYEAINANITDHGAVLVYMEDRNTWRQIPMTFYYSVVDEETNEVTYYSSSLEVSTYDEGVSVFWTENDFYDGYRPDHDIRFKIVVIAANIYKDRSDVDYSSYEAVKTAFQLAD